MVNKKYKLVINKEKCKGCELCIEVCPHGVISISDDVNKRGLRYVKISNPEKCTCCGLCVTMCPDCALEIAEE